MKKVWLAYETKEICTKQLQNLIDQCAEAGGGQVRLTPGLYLTGTLYMRSNVELYLEAGTVLRGSEHCSDYSNINTCHTVLPEMPYWYDALITATDAENFRIVGEGIIDGVDCQNPKGEQGFRGPHAIAFDHCSNIHIDGITIVRSACYHIMLECCDHVTVQNVKLRGGQDGFRFGDCSHVLVRACDIRTGDDCVGGSGNYDIQILDSMLNTPGGCMIMLGCVGLTVRNCFFWNTGFYPAVFQTNKRYSLSANAFFITYDYGYSGHEDSADWFIEDCVFENLCGLLRIEREFYGKKCIPIKNLVMKRISAVNLMTPIYINGQSDTSVVIEDSSLHFVCEAASELTYLHAENGKSVQIRNTVISSCAEKAVCSGNRGMITLEDARFCKSAAEMKTMYPRYIYNHITEEYFDKNVTEEFRGAIQHVPFLTAADYQQMKQD